MPRPKGSKNLSAKVGKKEEVQVEPVSEFTETISSEVGEEITEAPPLMPMDVEPEPVKLPEGVKLAEPKVSSNWYVVVRNPDLVPSQFKRDNNTVDVELIKAWLDADKKNVSQGVNGCLIGGGK